MRNRPSSTFVFSRPRPAEPIHPDGFRKLDHFTTTIQHHLYQAPIYCWLSEGYLRTEDHQRKSCYFIYMEYRDSSGASHYAFRHFMALHQALNWLGTRASTCPLPDICPKKTRFTPVTTESMPAKPSLLLKTPA